MSRRGFYTVDNDQLELFKTGWLPVLGAQAHIRHPGRTPPEAHITKEKKWQII